MDEVAVVVDGQGGAGEEQRSDDAGEQAEDLGGCAEQEDGDGSGYDGGEAQLGIPSG